MSITLSHKSDVFARSNKDKYKKIVSNFEYKNDDILQEWGELL